MKNCLAGLMELDEIHECLTAVNECVRVTRHGDAIHEEIYDVGVA
jgi:hypothetical protein